MKPLAERGFLFLLLSCHLHSSNGTLMVHIPVHTPIFVVVVVYYTIQWHSAFPFLKCREAREKRQRFTGAFCFSRIKNCRPVM